jgi:hypothetical protein
MDLDLPTHSSAQVQSSAGAEPREGVEALPRRGRGGEEEDGVPLAALRASRISSIDGESSHKRRGGGQRQAETGVCVVVCVVCVCCISAAALLRVRRMEGSAEQRQVCVVWCVCVVCCVRVVCVCVCCACVCVC